MNAQERTRAGGQHDAGDTTNTDFSNGTFLPLKHQRPRHIDLDGATRGDVHVALAGAHRAALAGRTTQAVAMIRLTCHLVQGATR